jgi:hypothetical protein
MKLINGFAVRSWAALTIVAASTTSGWCATATIGGPNDANIATDVYNATIFDHAPDNSLGAGPAMFSGTDGTGLPLRGLLKFDIADNIPAGSTVFGVQLQLYLGWVPGLGMGGTSGPATANIELHALSANWGDGSTGAGITQIGGTGQGFPANPGDATWNANFYGTSLWTNPGGDFAPSASAVTTVGNTIGALSTWGSTGAIVNDVQSWLDNPSTNFGWELINTDETDTRTLRGFYTSQSTTSTVRPEMVVTYARLAGDVNNDGIVNGQDIAVIASNWLQTGTGANDPSGDANFDGIVNGQDIAIIASHWLQTVGGGSGGGASVPEPSTVVLAALGGVALLASRWSTGDAQATLDPRRRRSHDRNLLTPRNPLTATRV